MAKPKTLVVYEGPHEHVHAGDRAFDRGRPVKLPAHEARTLTDQIDGLRVVKPTREKG